MRCIRVAQKDLVCAMQFGLGDKLLFVIGQSVPHPLLVYNWQQGTVQLTSLVVSTVNIDTRKPFKH